MRQYDAAVGMAVGYLSTLGYKVFLPVTHHQPYTLVVDDDGELKKVKVHSASYKITSGRYYVSLTLKGGQRKLKKSIVKFDPASVDYVFAVTPETAYMIPASKITGQSITFNEVWDEYKV